VLGTVLILSALLILHVKVSENNISGMLHSGAADIVGRRFGNKKLPYNPCKSYAGTVAMFFAGFITSIV
jgi:dolichol kinase